MTMMAMRRSEKARETMRELEGVRSLRVIATARHTRMLPKSVPMMMRLQPTMMKMFNARGRVSLLSSEKVLLRGSWDTGESWEWWFGKVEWCWAKSEGGVGSQVVGVQFSPILVHSVCVLSVFFV